MSGNGFDNFIFDRSACLSELAEFRELLDSNTEPSEQEQLLPKFRGWRHLTAFMGSYHPKCIRRDLLKAEFPFWENFRADFVIGDSSSKTYVLVEFEDARRDSLFSLDMPRKLSPHGHRLKDGVFQILDWFWRLEDFGKTSDYQRVFGSGGTDFAGLLVVGRDQWVDDIDRARLSWVKRRLSIGGYRFDIVTFDELCADLGLRLKAL